MRFDYYQQGICTHLHSSFRSLVFKIVKFHDFSHDKSFLKIRVNLSRGLWCFRTPLKILKDIFEQKNAPRQKLKRLRSLPGWSMP